MKHGTVKSDGSLCNISEGLPGPGEVQIDEVTSELSPSNTIPLMLDPQNPRRVIPHTGLIAQREREARWQQLRQHAEARAGWLQVRAALVRQGVPATDARVVEAQRRADESDAAAAKMSEGLM